MAGVIAAKGENHAENTELGTSSSGSVWYGPTLKLNLSQFIIVQMVVALDCRGRGFCSGNWSLLPLKFKKIAQPAVSYSDCSSIQ